MFRNRASSSDYLFQMGVGNPQNSATAAALMILWIGEEITLTVQHRTSLTCGGGNPPESQHTKPGTFYYQHIIVTNFG